MTMSKSPSQKNSPCIGTGINVVGHTTMPLKQEEVEVEQSNLTQEFEKGTLSTQTINENPQTNQEALSMELQQSRLISTLQREKEHLQNQCSAYESAGLQATIHNAEMKKIILHLQGTLQAFKERNYVLSNQFNEVSTYMSQITPRYHWYVNRVKVLEMNHSHLLQSYAELQTFCKSLAQQHGKNTATPGSGSEARNDERSETWERSVTATFDSAQGVVLSQPVTANTTECDPSNGEEVRKHRPFLQPKPAAFIDTNAHKEKMNISHDLLLEGNKTVEASSSSSLSSISRNVKKPRGSPRPSLQPRPPQSEQDVQEDSKVISSAFTNTSLKNTHQDSLHEASPGKITGTKNQTVVPTTTPILHQYEKRAFTTRDSSMNMEDNRHVTPSPPIRTQAGKNQVNMQYVHQHPYQYGHPYHNFVHNGGHHYFHPQNQNMNWMGNRAAAAVAGFHPNNMSTLHKGVSHETSAKPAHTSVHVKTSCSNKKGQKRSVVKSSSRGGPRCTTTNTSKQQSKRRKMSMSCISV